MFPLIAAGCPQVNPAPPGASIKQVTEKVFSHAEEGAAVNMIAKRCIAAGVLPLKCFSFSQPNFICIHVYAIIMQ